MTWDEEVTSAFKDNGIDFVAYLPDSVLSPLINRIEDDDWFDAHLVTREEEAIGLLSGVWLGGRRGALICQSSGLANTFNGLAGLSSAWGFPFIGIISRRGNLGEHNRAQIPAGYPMPDLLDTIGVRNAVIDKSRDLKQCTELGIDTAFSTEEPFVLLLGNTTTGGKE